MNCIKNSLPGKFFFISNFAKKWYFKMQGGAIISLYMNESGLLLPVILIMWPLLSANNLVLFKDISCLDSQKHAAVSVLVMLVK